MDHWNLFVGLDCELHTVREERSHKIFDHVYRSTINKVSNVAKRIAPWPHVFYSMSTTSDYVQEGYSGVWMHLENYKWICPMCGLRFSTAWGFQIHGCNSQSKSTISEYASFVLRRAMKHYRVKHIADRRDERRNRSIPENWLEWISPIDVGDLVQRKATIDLVWDVVALEPDPIVRFFVESCLDYQSVSEIYDEGLGKGLWADRRDAWRWMCDARKRDAFAPYQRALAE